MNCRICENSENLKTYEVKEMMFGSKEVFTYFECKACGTLQISEIPENIYTYYPTGYYSHSSDVNRRNILKEYLRKCRDRYAVSGNGFLGRLLFQLFPDHLLSIYAEFPKNVRILDVGCGTGDLIRRLKYSGFTDLSGIDPLIPETLTISEYLRIEKKSIREINEKWDLITYHHSFEHIADPFGEMNRIAELLSDKGICIIRIPVTTSYAWEHYQADWVQIDAPRHFFLYSVKSFMMLVERTGFEVLKMIFDSTDFQFWGSEQIKINIALNDDKSYLKGLKKSIFRKREITEFKKNALKLNLEQKGDQVIFYLGKKKYS